MRRGAFHRVTSLLAVGGLLVGCAGLPSQRVAAYPAGGQPQQQVATDQAACDAYAEGESGTSEGAGAAGGAVGGAAIGAAAGAILGAIVGAFAGRPGAGAAFGAAVGGASGGMQGAAGGAVGVREAKDKRYAACMAAKGYSVAR